MEGHVELAEMREQAAAQLEHHPLADPAGHGDEHPGRDRLQRDGDGERRGNAEQRCRIVRVQQRREAGVDSDADQPRPGQHGQAGRHDQRHGEGHPAPVRAQQVTEQAPAPLPQ